MAVVFEFVHVIAETSVLAAFVSCASGSGNLRSTKEVLSHQPSNCLGIQDLGDIKSRPAVLPALPFFKLRPVSSAFKPK